MQTFKSKISNIKSCFDNSPLPGLASQLKLAPITRLAEHTIPIAIGTHASEWRGNNPKKSAVLILFYPKSDRIHLAMIVRATDNSIHSGQVSFPGGMAEKDDLSLNDTALREANEEIGIVSDSVTIIGQLTKLYIPPSNFDVYPIIGVTYSPPIFKSNNEVQKILEIDLATLTSPETRTHKQIQHRTGKDFMVPCYYIQGEVIWGASAMIISELLEVVNSEE